MTEERRDAKLTEVFHLMEQEQATLNDWWDAVFPTLEWCEHELRGLGFHSDYDDILEILEDANNPNDPNTIVPEIVHKLRTIDTDDPDGELLDWDSRATLITALRYRKWYLNKDV